MPLKLTASIFLFLITIAISLQAGEKSEKKVEEQDKDKSKVVIPFDSCGKNSGEKCKKDKNLPSPNYSSYFK